MPRSVLHGKRGCEVYLVQPARLGGGDTVLGGTVVAVAVVLGWILGGAGTDRPQTGRRPR